MRSLSTILWAAFLASIGAFLQQSESAPGPSGTAQESPAVLTREDKDGESICTMLVDGKRIWQATTPILTMADVNDEGCLVGLGSVDIRYGSERERADAFVIINSEGKLCVLDAFRPVTNQWPHGNTYPVYLGVHATEYAAVFRFVPGSGLREQWWSFDIQSGARLIPVTIADALASALDPEHKYLLTPVSTHALNRASLFAVALAPIDEVIAHEQDKESKPGFSGSTVVLVDLEGVVWSRWDRSGSYLIAQPEVRTLDRETYEVQVKRRVGSSDVVNTLRVEKKSDGVWEPRVVEWD